MKIAKRAALAVLLLLLIEVLHLHVDSVSWRGGRSTCLSLGFPFRSVEYRVVELTEGIGPLSENEGTPGFKADPILFVIDLLVAFLLGLLLVRCVPGAALLLATKGCVLGTVTGAAISWLFKMSPESWLSGAVGLIVVFAVVPFTIYVFSLGHKWQKAIISVISGVTLLTFWHAFFLVEGLFDGVMEDDVSLNLPMILRLLALLTITVCECLVLMILHRKVLPVVLRSRQLDNLPVSTGNDTGPKLACDSEPTHRRRIVRRAVLYTSLLAITFYVGCHFSILRKMRYDDWLVFDAICSELERLDVPLDSVVVTGERYPLEVGLNVYYRVEVQVRDEDAYYAQIKKHILIPWFQVEIHKTDTTEKTNERQRLDQ